MAKKDDDLQHGLSGTSRCCLCCDNGKCMRCTCVKAGRKCLNCLPSKRNHCSNRLQCDSLPVCDDASLLARDSSNVLSPSSVEGERFVRAFGAHSEGKPRGTFWGQLWLRIVSIKNSHYNLPNGSVGCDFVSLLSGEVNLLVQGSISSEMAIVFLTVILQRDPMIKRNADIRHLLLRRMEDWKGEKFTDLVFDAERCLRQHIY